MKTIKDSGKDHWAIGKQFTCMICDSVHEIESAEDFDITNTLSKVRVICPKCSAEAALYKVLKINPDPHRWGGFDGVYIMNTLNGKVVDSKTFPSKAFDKAMDDVDKVFKDIDKVFR